jgi:hypothetical protein
LLRGNSSAVKFGKASFHLSTSFAARRERRSAQASILSAWMRCCVDLSKGLPAE